MTAVVDIYRYPVKGLSGNRLDEVALQAGRGIPFDRAYALAHGEVPFDPGNPHYLSKTKFLMLMKDNRLAQLETSFIDSEERLIIAKGGKLLLDVSLRDDAQRQQLNAFFEEFMAGKTRGGVKLVSSPGHMFADIPDQNLSLINLDSIADLAGKTGLAIDPRRFRGNLYIRGLEAWRELDLIGREFQVGAVRFRATARTSRCAATNVNPATAEIDMNIPLQLRKTCGHLDMGIYADVIEPGTLKCGDPVTI